MKRELGILNALCIIVALLFIGFAVLNAIVFSAELLTTDNLFVTMVCMVMALMFIINPLLYLRSEGRLPMPSMKRLRRTETAAQLVGVSPPLLDARGRAVPPDVSAMLARMKKTPSSDT
jgi:hypothetical protein